MVGKEKLRIISQFLALASRKSIGPLNKMRRIVEVTVLDG